MNAICATKCMAYFNRLFYSVFIRNCLSCFLFVYIYTVWASPLMYFHSFILFCCSKSILVHICDLQRCVYDRSDCFKLTATTTTTTKKNDDDHAQNSVCLTCALLDLGLCVCVSVSKMCIVCLFLRNIRMFIDMNGKSLALATHKLMLVFIRVHVS